MAVAHRETKGGITLTVRARDGAFVRAGSRLLLEFTDAATGRPVDVSAPQLRTTMFMPGMPMTGGGRLTPTGRVGIFAGTADFSMSGTWQFAVTWQGASGPQSVSFEGDVQ